MPKIRRSGFIVTIVKKIEQDIMIPTKIMTRRWMSLSCWILANMTP